MHRVLEDVLHSTDDAAADARDVRNIAELQRAARVRGVISPVLVRVNEVLHRADGCAYKLGDRGCVAEAARLAREEGLELERGAALLLVAAAHRDQ